MVQYKTLFNITIFIITKNNINVAIHCTNIPNIDCANEFNYIVSIDNIVNNESGAFIFASKNDKYICKYVDNIFFVYTLTKPTLITINSQFINKLTKHWKNSINTYNEYFLQSFKCIYLYILNLMNSLLPS